MNYYWNEDGNCLVVDLRDCNESERTIYGEVLERYTFMTQESYEDNLYHIYVSQDPNFKEKDEEDIYELQVKLDEAEEEIDDIYDEIVDEMEELLEIEY